MFSETEIEEGSDIEKNPEFTHPLSSKTSTEYIPEFKIVDTVSSCPIRP